MAPATDDCPELQAAHWFDGSVSSSNRPTGQSVHSAAAVAAKLPLESLVNWPAAQLEHADVCPAAAALPASQSVHAVLGLRSWSYLPAAQSSQVPAPAAAYSPAVHVVQLVDAAAADVPALHWVQVVLALESTSAYPATQSVQPVDAAAAY
jgi:hypothetical protein